MRSKKRDSIRRRQARRNERGAALITALLLLFLVTGLSTVMAISLNSDMMMNGYFGNFRGAFYAADSGLAVVRQQLANQLLASVSASFSTSSAPIANGSESTVLSAVVSQFSNSASSPVAVASGSSWPSSFYIDTTTPSGSSNANTFMKLVSCSVTPTGGSTTTYTNATCPTPPSGYNQYLYAYDYQYVVRTVGIGAGGQKAAVREDGDIIVNVNVGTTQTTTLSFSSWGTFINISPQCNAELIGGTITGPQFTNGSWTFGDDYSYTFTDSVGSASSTAGYYFDSNHCYSSTHSSYSYGGSTIAPTFQNGLNLNQSTIPLPANDYNQKRAVIDGLGTSSTSVSNTELNASVKNASGTPYPTGGTSSGVYLPYSINAQTGAATFTGGGIYVEGDASVALSTSGTTGQVYTITQGTTVNTITVDNTANTTTFTTKVGTGSPTTKTITGVPVQYLTSGGSSSDATMLYVNGNVTSLQSTTSSSAAIQNGTALTITASNNITITDNILYKSEPVTLTASGSTPVGSLIPANDTGQTLGIFTANGTVILKPNTYNQDLQIDATIAATSTADSNDSSCDQSNICRGTISVANGSNVGTLTIVGGRIQNRAQVISSGVIDKRNIIFDRRYLGGGFAPPFYPNTTVTTTGSNTDYSGTSTATIQRKQWVSQLAY